MKKARLARIIVESPAKGQYRWWMYAPNGRPIARSMKDYPSQQAAVKHLETLAAKGVLGNAVVVAG